MQIVIEIPDDYYKAITEIPNHQCTADMLIIKNGTPLSKIVDSLKELSKDHRHNYISNSHEERAWRLGIEDSIDLLLAESEDKE